MKPLAFIVSLVLGSLSSLTSLAQSSFTWTGSSSGNWNDNGNWTQGADGPGGSSSRPQTYLNFPSGAGNLNNTNNYAAFSGAFQIYFNSGASAYNLYGNALKFYDYSGTAAAIQNDSSSLQTINFPFGAGNSAGININPNSGDLTINGSTSIFLDGPSQIRVNGNSGRTVTFNVGIGDGSPAGGTFALNGAATARFTAANTFTGDAFINNGMIRLSVSSALASSFLRLGDTSGSASANLNLDGGFTLSTAINVRSGSSGTKTIANTSGTSGTATFAGNLFLDADATAFANSSGSVTFSGVTLDLKNQTLTVDGSGNTTISRALTNSTGSGKLTKNGAGTLSLGSSNFFTGGLIIKAGTVSATLNDALSFGAGTIRLGDSATGADATIIAANGVFPTFTNAITVDPGAGVRKINTQSANSGQSPTFSGAVTLSNTMTLGATSTGGLRINGSINDGAGTNGLIVDSSGSGPVRLNAANTFDGGIILKRGLLEQNTSATALGTGTLTLGDTSGANNAIYNPAGTGFTAANAITVAAGNTGIAYITNGSGSSFVLNGNVALNNNLTLTANGSGNLTLGGTNTGGASVNITNAGTGAGSVTLSGVIANGSGTVGIVQNSSTSVLNVNNGTNSFTGPIAIRAGTFAASPGTATSYTLAGGAISLGDSTLNANVELKLSGRLSTSSANTINVLGSGTHTITGTHNNNGQIHLLPGAITLNGNDLTFITANAAGFRVQAGVSGTGNLIIFNTNSSGNGVDFRTVAVNNSGSISNASTGTGAVSQGTAVSFGANVTSLIQNSATSPWNVNQANGNFAGTAQVLAGTMNLQNASALSVNNTVFIASGAKLDIQNVNQTLAGLNNVSGAGGTITNSTGLTTTTLTLGGSGTYSFSGTLGVTNLALAKSGSGTQTLSGNNTFIGGTTISGGTLKLGHTNALGTGSASISSGATLDLSGQNITNVISPAGTGVSGTGALVNSDTGNAAALNSEIVNGTSYTVGGAGNLTIQRSRSGGSPFIVTKVGTGTFTLGNANATSHNNLLALDVTSTSTVNLGMTGSTISADRGVRIQAGGTVRYTGTSANMLSDNPEVIVSNGTLDLNGKSDTAGKLTIGDGSNNGIISGGSGSTYTVAATYNAFGVNGTAGTSTIEAMSGSVDVQLAGSGIALNKTTGGTVTLSQTNSYSGDTTISAGTLVLSGNGSITNSPTISVASGATFDVTNVASGFTLAAAQVLKGNGAINGPATINGTVAPGASIGTLTFTNSPTLNGTVLMEINTTNSPATNDLLVVSGNPLTFGGTLTVTNTGDPLAGGESFTLFSASSLGGSFSATNLPTLSSGLNWWLGQLLSNGRIIVNRAPTNLTQTVTRNAGASLRITKSALMTSAGDPDSGDSASYDALTGTGSQGADVSEDATYIYYEPTNSLNDTLQFRLNDTRGGTASINLNINVITGGASAGGIAQQIIGSPSSVTVTFAGIPTFKYDVERAGDVSFTSPMTILTTNAPANGIFSITDNSPPSPSFYRLKYNPN
ncbi:MAG: hypothetical protein EPO07_17265 [Verrucomicrobia bacterium]|nr:MAG: hypothetical protein EPO07_17265 [Verrucomicrobiota bacterium]